MRRHATTMLTDRLKSCARKAAALLAVLLLAPIVLAEASISAEPAPKTVRVGWYASDRFQSGMTDAAEKGGYCYDFLQSIGDYTSWKYEYVYGEWPELLEKLKAGDIDVMAGISKTAERRRAMLFPDVAMGRDTYYLYKRSDDSTIKPRDFSSLAGKTVGVVKENRTAMFAERFIAENQLDLRLVYFDSFHALEAAFDRGSVDLMAQTLNNVSSRRNVTIVAKVGEEPFYLAVNSRRQDLLQAIDAALDSMISINPYVLQNLQYKHYGTSLTARTLTEQENAWLKSHPALSVGYLDDYLPFSGTNASGEATGIAKDVLAQLLVSLDTELIPEIHFRPYQTSKALLAALKQKEVDLIFPVEDDFWRLDQKSLAASSPVIEGSRVFFYRGASYQKDNVHRVAINRNFSTHIDDTKDAFPDAEFIYFDSFDECLKAVVEGTADGVVMHAMRTQYVTSNAQFSSLSYVHLPLSANLCFGVNRGDVAPLLLLNRGLRLIGADFGLKSSHKYMAAFHTYEVMDFVQDHRKFIVSATILLSALIISLLGWNLSRKQREIRSQQAHLHEMTRLNAELKLLKNEADAANDAKTKFLFNMSHDIRTPMNAILGFTHLMEDETTNPEKLKDHLKKVKASGEYLLGLINNLLEVARIDSGKETLDEVFADLMSDECSVLPFFESDFLRKRIACTRQMNIEHQYVFADVAKLREISMNLISNAVKYTPEDGIIDVKVHEEASPRKGFARYVIKIRDTGIGMSKAYLGHIFEAFSREKNSTESGVIGTGLGMSIVKRLLDLMKGSIAIESEVGKGSTFTVTLDFRIAENPQALLAQKHEATPKAVSLAGKRLLLAEDNELNAEIAVAILEQAGAAVDVAADGVICINKLLEKDAGYYDLILMDVQMPNLNGYQTARKIRSLTDEKRARIPIVAMTANAFAEDKANALAAGMNGHLAKPIVVNDLMKMLASLL